MSKIEDPDLNRCQALKPGNGPFVIGGEIGNPNDGYRTRCRTKPIYVVIENLLDDNGDVRWISLCQNCYTEFKKQFPELQTSEYQIDSIKQKIKKLWPDADESSIDEYTADTDESSIDEYTAQIIKLLHLSEDKDLDIFEYLFRIQYYDFDDLNVEIAKDIFECTRNIVSDY